MITAEDFKKRIGDSLGVHCEAGSDSDMVWLDTMVRMLYRIEELEDRLSETQKALRRIQRGK